ncbi:MAG TPA: GC-type dockerin domain-anchored protein [Phycisphaerales bacterium]|nr:GC-type dockerin domain-anchored protein [Phycisphaerales bacterium]
MTASTPVSADPPPPRYRIIDLGNPSPDFRDITPPEAAAYSINDHGWIVGYGIFDDGSAEGAIRAYLLIPQGMHAVCPGDLRGVTAPYPDGVVDVLDLIFLLAAWGPCPTGDCCPADLNGSGSVDVQDLLILLGNWGSCPTYPSQSVASLSESLTAAGLTSQNWNDFQSVMMGEASVKTKANWKCWMENYLMQCTNCPACPGDDPFAE